MKIKFLSERLRYNKTIKWHKWFAWYPVRISDESLIWLQYVQRKRITESTYLDVKFGNDRVKFEYRLIVG